MGIQEGCAYIIGDLRLAHTVPDGVERPRVKEVRTLVDGDVGQETRGISLEVLVAFLGDEVGRFLEETSEGIDALDRRSDSPQHNKEPIDSTHLHLLRRDDAAVVSWAIAGLDCLRTSLLRRGNAPDPERDGADLTAPLAVAELVAHGATLFGSDPIRPASCEPGLQQPLPENGC